MQEYPCPDQWEHASSRQRERARRSLAELEQRGVPAYHGPLMVDDDDEVDAQSAQDVARRTLVLWAVELRGEGVSRDEAREIIDFQDLWESVSPNELRLLDVETLSQAESQEMVWHLESLWVLMWALGYLEELGWPSGMCDVTKLATLIAELEDEPSFIAEATLRPVAELLDAQDLTMRIHWAIRDALLHQSGCVPEDLVWSDTAEYLPVPLSAAARVVQERHYVLNWLVNYLDPQDWDHVDTPT